MPTPLAPPPAPDVSDLSTSVLFVRKMPNQLRADFKAYCAKRKLTMRDAIIGFFQDCVEKDGIVVNRRKAKKKTGA